MSEAIIQEKKQKPVNPKIAAIAIMIASLAYWVTRMKATAIMPVIAGDLDGMNYYTWANTMFMLTAAIFAPLWGKIGDLFGKKRTLVILLGFMLLGDLLAAFAPNIWVFVVGFGICGVGGGGMQGTYFAMLGDLFPPDKRGKYGGYILVIMSAIMVLMPLVAAAITDNLSWRYVFILSSLIYVIAIICTIILVPKYEKKSDSKPRIDWIGTILLAIAVVPFLLALSWGGSKYKWGDTRIVVMLVVAVVFFVLTYMYERKHPDYAIISVRLLKNRSFIFACLVSLFMAASMTTVSTFGSLFVQGVQRKSSTVYAGITSPSNIVGIFSGAIAGWLMDKTKRYKWLLVLAPTCACITCVVFGLLPATASAGFLIALLIFFKVFGSGYMPSINPLAAMAQIEPEDFGLGTGTLNFITALGNAIAPALLGSVLNGSYAKAIVNTTANLTLTDAQIKTVSSARVLVNAASMNALKESFGANTALYEQTVNAVVDALLSALKSCFFTGAACVVLSIIFALLVKETPLDQVKYKKK